MRCPKSIPTMKKAIASINYSNLICAAGRFAVTSARAGTAISEAFRKQGTRPIGPWTRTIRSAESCVCKPLQADLLGFAAAQGADKKRLQCGGVHQQILLPFMVVKQQQHRRMSIYRHLHRRLWRGHRLAAFRRQIPEAVNIIAVR